MGELLEYYQEHASHMELDFEEQEGCGIQARLPDASPECLDLLQRMLEYEPQARITAGEALRHPFFDEVREVEARKQELSKIRRPNTLKASNSNEPSARGRIRASTLGKAKKSMYHATEEKHAKLPRLKENTVMDRKGHKSKKKLLRKTFKSKKQFGLKGTGSTKHTHGVHSLRGMDYMPRAQN